MQHGQSINFRRKPGIAPDVLACSVVRSAVEIAAIYVLNLVVYNGIAASVEDGLGLALIFGVAIFCCVVTPLSSSSPKTWCCSGSV
jgi:hypothetical protein